MKLNIDINHLTLAELGELEDITGEKMGELVQSLQAGAFSVKFIQALVFLQERRSNRAFTLEMAGRLDFDEIELVVPDADEVDPTGGESSET